MRNCCKCNKKMFEGYYAAGLYYCDCDCLSKDYKPKEWEEAYNENDDEYYWSTFED